MSLKRFKQHLKTVQYIAGCYVHALEPGGKKKTKFIGDGVLALGSICSRFFLTLIKRLINSDKAIRV
jgi:hypothetical protein